MTMNDGGSTPEQYALPEDATELQDLIEYREMNFAIGNIFKACYRLGVCKHSDVLRDLNKILWFAQRELDRISPGAPIVITSKEELLNNLSWTPPTQTPDEPA